MRLTEEQHDAQDPVRPERGQRWRHRQYPHVMTVAEVFPDKVLLQQEDSGRELFVDRNLLWEHYRPEQV